MAINFNRLEDITKGLKGKEQTGRAFHATFIYKGPKLISIGLNNYNKSHKSKKYGVYESNKNYRTYRACIHSEVSAIIKAGVQDCSGLTFVNVRIDNNGKPAVSKPCNNCMKLITEQVGYKNLWYYDGRVYIKH